MIRLLVAGDVRLYREGLARYLADEPDVCVVACPSSRSQLRSFLADAPDVILLDMAMPESLATLWELAQTVPSVRVLALSVPEADADVLACAEAGIAGYVTREGSLDDLVAAVRSAARGESIVSPRMAASLLRRVSALALDRPRAGIGEALTVREREIARLVDDGMSNKQIAARLCIEVATVKNHVHRILDKLQAHRRGEIGARLRRAVSDPPSSFSATSQPIRR
jgi:DNA-binding NarL/FixJ family response regulator